jgi:hypothetical protein
VFPNLVDRRLFTRLADAIDPGLAKVAPCEPDEYAGPWPGIVLRSDLNALSVGIDWATRDLVLNPQLGAATWVSGLHNVADHIAWETGNHDLDIRWLEIADNVPYCINDACADFFEPIVKNDPSAVLWHVASSLHCWAHSGVWTPSILAETLDRWAPMTDIDRWCRHHARVNDRYVSFMASYATRLLDGHVQEHDHAWLRRYFEVIDS